MTRKDRLFALIDHLRDGDTHRAETLAARFGVSVRTIYRDMDRLAASGLPLRGTRGSGYQLVPGISLPPLTLSEDELEALNLGLAIVAQAADNRLRRAADSLTAKLDTALPTKTIAEAAQWADVLSPFADPTRNLRHMPLLRSALEARQKVRLTYTGTEGTVTSRIIRPLHLGYLGRIWTLTAWCETRDAFRVFRLDLMESAEALPELFTDEPGKRLADYAPDQRTPPPASPF
ncbi:putative transcriptional regulator [Sulfitobacter noctilucae]|uniref:helix-turn-helix transcriptional regulator n=1 Tax=Sulfitobacter noctilucae TaxID=1342302 RepID=UPI0004685130|nr:YafY family protein [Sulfitobacter noctilucae]KIN61378.1 putative transcriptional regulator [Sulfitobacter noctilucae]